MAADLDQYAHDAVIADGRTIRIRPITSDDADRLWDMWKRLSDETSRLRFFGPRPMDRDGIGFFTDLDMRTRFALIAETAGRIVGVSRFDLLDEQPGTAEFAVLVEDSEQGRGIGTALLRALLQPAEDRK